MTRLATVPDTPLCTASNLIDQRNEWPDMQEEMEKTLATMRVDKDDMHIKNLSDSHNKLLEKRKAAMEK